MKGFIYLYQRTIINRVKHAAKHPATYIMLVFIVGYLVLMYEGLQVMIAESNMGTPESLVTILSGIILMLIPGNIISYSKRKGLLFRPSEVHFVFSAPVSPKMVLMFTGVKSFAVNILLGLAVAEIGRAHV